MYMTQMLTKAMLHSCPDIIDKVVSQPLRSISCLHTPPRENVPPQKRLASPAELPRNSEHGQLVIAMVPIRASGHDNSMYSSAEQPSVQQKQGGSNSLPTFLIPYIIWGPKSVGVHALVPIGRTSRILPYDLTECALF